MLGQNAWETFVSGTLGLVFAIALLRSVREGLGSGERGVAAQTRSRDN